ncbi:hypothetical protein LO763_11730 [Glycomyces sp. A-F 0318]|uniref:hypothetical protein n=1 Tax=Glycomyces amatae TaxID=2881355 RepID=UPI001E29473E|nr:hypothetical protein [Glycomyces amatae]MCD0444292.1 hypothetical protein [Glycomyces amatae]
MGYTASYEGRIAIDPPMDAGTWQRLLDPHPNYGAIAPGVRKIVSPIIMPVLSEDRSTVIAVEPEPYGCSPSAMHGALEHFVHFTLLLSHDEGRHRRFSGGFDGWGESGEQYRVTIGDTDPIKVEETDPKT